MKGKADRLHRVCMVRCSSCYHDMSAIRQRHHIRHRKKYPTSHDVNKTLAVSGRHDGKTQRHVIKTNCGRHLKRRHFQLSVAPTVIVTIKRRRIPSVRLRKASSRRRIMGQHRHICHTPPPLLPMPMPPLLTRYRSESLSSGCRVRQDQQRVRPP